MTVKSNNRKVVRQPVRDGEYLGRDGKPLIRKVNDTVNPFEVPAEHREDAWDYQWVRNSCFGKIDTANVNKMVHAGWRPVQHEQMPGFMKSGENSQSGAIEHEGLVLMERPVGMTNDALAEHATANRALERQQYQKFDIAPPAGSRFEARNDQRMIRKGQAEQIAAEFYPERKHAVSGSDID